MAFLVVVEYYAYASTLFHKIGPLPRIKNIFAP